MAENTVENYRRRNGLLNAEGYSVTERQLAELNKQLIDQNANLRESVARLESLNRQVSSGEGADTIAAVLQSRVITALRTEQAGLARRKSDLATKYGGKHPEMQKITREEGYLQTQIDQEIQRIVASLEGEVDVAQSRVDSLEQSIERMRLELTGNNQALVGLRELESAAELSRTQYENFISQYQETLQVTDLTEADAKIGSRALVPVSPILPNKPLNIIFGTILSLGIGIGIILLVEAFDSGLRTGDQVERTLRSHFISYVPSLSSGPLAVNNQEPRDYLVDKPLSAFAEAYRTIRSEIMLSKPNGERPKAIALTSTKSGEGKTVSSVCLGRICAMSGDKVIVIDCDIRRRILSGAVSEIDSGLVEVLTGQEKLAKAIRKDNKTNLHILPISSTLEGTTDIFNTSNFKSMIDTLKTVYDLIILDTAPVTAIADTRTIISSVDASIQIVKWRETTVREAQAASYIINQLDTPNLGVVLTQVDFKEQAQYGYYGSYQKLYSS